MAIPQWLMITIACVVLGYGVVRLWLAFAGPSNDQRAAARTGLLAMGRRTHGVVGAALLIAGAMLLAIGLGWDAPWSKREVAAPAPSDHPAGGSALPIGP
jgi:TPP-dependent pyruvate/acetoin dehydrogenase alpha subunit